MQLSSPSNPRIKEWQKLLNKKGRAESGRFLIEGSRLIADAFLSDAQVEVLLYDADKADRMGQTILMAQNKGVELIEANARVIAALSDTDTPQGMVAICVKRAHELTVSGRKGSVIVALDHLQDPGNIGTILRTAEAAGVEGVVLEGCAEVYNPKIVRATMGAVFRLPFLVTEDMIDKMSEYKSNGYQIIVTTLEGQDFYARIQTDCPKVLVIGSEAQGISERIVRLADQAYTLPMRGGAESLNAAVAAGICIYELTYRG